MTKTLKMAFAALTLMALSVGLMPRSAKAVNLSELQTAFLNTTEEVRRVQLSTSTQLLGVDFAAINLQYVGSSTESVVTIGTAAISFFAPAGTADTTVGVSGIVSWSIGGSGSTIGAVCDSINAASAHNYICTMLDARRNDPAQTLMDQTAAGSNTSTNLKAVGGYNIAFGTATGTNNTDFSLPNGAGAGVGSLSLGITPLPGKQVVLKSCKLNTNSTNAVLSATFTVTGVNEKFENDASGRLYNDSTLVWSQAVSSVTDTTILFYDPTGGSPAAGGLRFAHGQQTVPGPSGTPPGAANIGRVVVRVQSGDVNAAQEGIELFGQGNSVPSYLQCYWLEQ